MNETSPWTRVPMPIDSEADRRTLAAILSSVGLEVRVIRARSGQSKSAPWKRYVEYREPA